jgi:hypothetical protein
MGMAGITLEFLTLQLQLADELGAGRRTMFDPQDLPGRYGRIVRAVDHVLSTMSCVGLLGGGWAVWRHGYVGRITQDLDILLPADRIDEFLRVAGVSGFEVLPRHEGLWPKLRHKDTDISVDILPEGGRPGTKSRPAPTTIPSPTAMSAQPGLLRYVPLPFLIELKLAAGRARDESDVIELLRANSDQVETIRDHLARAHADYAQALTRLLERAGDQRDA